MSDDTKKEETAKKEKVVKIRALRPFEEKGRVVIPGETLEVIESRAAELTKHVQGPFDFFGERISGTRDHRRANLAKAELVA